MPFGLHNAAKTFQIFLDQVLRGLPFAYAYIDDVMIASATQQELQEHLKHFFLMTTKVQYHRQSCEMATGCIID